jgi:hypothetical protein
MIRANWTNRAVTRGFDHVVRNFKANNHHNAIHAERVVLRKASLLSALKVGNSAVVSARTIAIVMMAIVAMAAGRSFAGSVEPGRLIAVNDSADAANGPCGYYGHPPCKIDGWNACALLTPDDLAAVSGEPWTQQGSGPMRPLAGADLINQCQYNGQGKQGYDIEITIVHAGGRAQFDKIVPARDTRRLSAVGDAAYLNVEAAGAHAHVIQGSTYFEIRLQSYRPNPNLGAWAVAFARKAAGKIKPK